jgi:hypothetical protein
MALLDFILRCLMSAGTAYMVYRLTWLWLVLPDAEQRLLQESSVMFQGFGRTMTAFREQRLLPMALVMQAVCVLLLWAGWATGHTVIDAFTPWVSLTGAAGGSMLFTLRPGMMAHDLLQEADRHLLQGP